MAASLNKATLIGCLGKDPEVKTFSNGNQVANFSIATSESWKDKATGEKKERTQWHKVCVFNPHLIKLASAHLKKGMSVYLEGTIETREYESDGTKKYITEIVLRPYNGEIKILTWPKDSKPADGNVDESEPAKRDDGVPLGGFANGGKMDDEIPFLWAGLLLSFGIGLMKISGIA